MKALILNSGIGRRMGLLASDHPKCMTEIGFGETILSSQLRALCAAGITEVVMTTGRDEQLLTSYCESLELPLNITFVNNPEYMTTNYIYSIYLARRELHDDILLLHGDLVFENGVLDMALGSDKSCVTVSSSLPLPEKDFKAQTADGKVMGIGVELFENAAAAQPLYKLKKSDWEKWLDRIISYCENGKTDCYAENALNEITGEIELYPLDIKDKLCGEIDCAEDLDIISAAYKKVRNKTVYLCFSTDILHSGHFSVIKKAKRLGRLIIGERQCLKT